MKNWWRKWTHEIPLVITDALWEVCVVQFADFLSRLTLRRIIEFIAIAILVTAFVQTLPIDLALLVAGDVVTYLELTALVWLLAGRYRNWIFINRPLIDWFIVTINIVSIVRINSRSKENATRAKK